ncbi:pyridoxal-phosphate dependent enzyme [Dactylosporangium sp. AC04546]|uniref:pyridoxal-phosphate dependent enzyme n=1 Tax=Dactylosporangium sp. AC04546 TaxID=2862460 RepID=UPI001EDFF34C|nr:pyridoxal-phosphate dependent enzyme [Dactylosporangium sp. AC04546]WVK80029.1 pyridoxal-phosphate dependent enzyme [Dactylosporangium sp. AC04546]
MSIPSFGTWPTPLEPAPRLAAAVGLGELWVKRDDLTGLGGGGNKVRKLRHSCAQALAAGSTHLVTTGAAQSNHARLTAAAGARLGLAVTLVLKGDAPAELRGNLVLDLLAGATIVWAGDRAADEVADEQERRIRDDGGVPFLIPFGGSSRYSARGYLECAQELEAQLPGIDRVVVALGSGGTAAGLVAGLGGARVVGVDVGAVPDPVATLRQLGVDGELPLIERGQVGAGYGALAPGVAGALRLAARTEGLFLDPTYTGRALAGLRACVADGRIGAGERTVFVHTGGLPGLFAHPEVDELRA